MKKQHKPCKKSKDIQHKGCKKLRKYVPGGPIYEDFPCGFPKGDMEWCESCQRWLSPSYYKSGKPHYTHSCYDAKVLDANLASHDAKITASVVKTTVREIAKSGVKLPLEQTKFPKNWGKLREIKPHMIDDWINQWTQWIMDEIKAKTKKRKDITKGIGK